MTHMTGCHANSETDRGTFCDACAAAGDETEADVCRWIEDEADGWQTWHYCQDCADAIDADGAD